MALWVTHCYERVYMVIKFIFRLFPWCFYWSYPIAFVTVVTFENLSAPFFSSCFFTGSDRARARRLCLVFRRRQRDNVRLNTGTPHADHLVPLGFKSNRLSNTLPCMPRPFLFYVYILYFVRFFLILLLLLFPLFGAKILCLTAFHRR